MLKLVALVALLLFGSPATVQSTPVEFWDGVQPSSATLEEGTYRLPNNTFPLHYDIHLTTHLDLIDANPEKFKFDGIVSIRLRVLETTNYVTVHARQLRILTSSLTNDRGERLEWLDVQQPEYNAAKEFLTYRVKDYLYPDEVLVLRIEYSGFLREDNGGFYRSSYIDADGNTRWLGTTQFESTNARHAFPSYDEPQIRAVYSLTINAHKHYTPISNMPVLERVESDDDFVATTFKDTPSMQTYLVAFVVSDFHYIMRGTSLDVTQRVFGRPAAIDNGEGDFAIDAGIKILRHQQDYFGVKYDLPKLDQIAIPDFAAGAMENWGLVTYREQYLLYDEEKPSLDGKRKIASVIAHEYAHQFYGNLVAPRWWDYLWLNEGFATLYEYEFLSYVYPEYRDRDFVVPSCVQYAMLRDATDDTRPMTTFVDRADGFPANTGYIVYQKAGSVLRMLQLALTEETFKKGMTYYLENKQYSTANSDDLARALEKSAREDNTIPRDAYMKDIIDSWSLKSGYPVVHVAFNDRQQIRLDQSKFTYKEEQSDDLWYIPVTIATESSPHFNHTAPITWFNTKTTGISPTTDVKWFLEDWILVNVQEMGYFRVNYADILWVRLSKKLMSDSFEDIHHLNRAQLVDDALNIARTSSLSYYIALQVTEYLHQEKEFAPWMSANVGFAFMNRLLGESSLYDDFKHFINDLVSPLFADLGIEDGGAEEPLSEKTKRTIGINWACLTGDQSCIDAVTKKVEDAIADPEKEPSADLRYVTYCNGLRNAEDSLFYGVWKRMQQDQDQGYRRTLIQALGCVTSGLLQSTYLNTTLNDNREEVDYREQEKIDVLNSVLMYGGSNGVETIIAFLAERYAEIQIGFIGSSNPVGGVARNIAEYVTSEDTLMQYTALLDVLIGESILTEMDKEQLVAKSIGNIDWVTKNEADIHQFLVDYNERNI